MDHPNIAWETEFSQLFQSIEEELAQASAIYLIIDEHVSGLWLNDLLEQCTPIAQANVIEIPAGEECKEMEILQHIWNQWIEDQADRNAYVINIGGGSTTDLGGMAAALYKRGISFAHIPTTLTGMVDAAIGGKNAINLSGIKNVVGTFQDPDQLIICPHFLETLEEKEIISGFAEMIKHALIADSALWEAYNELEEIDVPHIIPFIKRNIQIKNHVVFEDPFEENIRKQLNFGHTLGHALESYWLEIQQPQSHGYCVGLGMKYATVLSEELEAEQQEEVLQFLDEIFPQPPSMPTWENILTYLAQDKKNKSGKLKFTLLEEIGKAKENQDVSWEKAKSVYDSLFHKS